MVFCTKCGNKLSEDAYFCSRCGAKTQAGVQAGVASSSEEMREAFGKMGEEMEKAFRTAAKEMERAFKTARDNVKKSTSMPQKECPHCGEDNTGDAEHCTKCGKRLD